MDTQEVKVNFKQLLNDITYTNMVFKTFDVKSIITTQQIYALKDYLVEWLLKHQMTENYIEGFERLIDKYGRTMDLVKLNLKYDNTECRIHQVFSSKISRILGLGPYYDEIVWDNYIPTKYDIEYNETEFKTAINRLYMCRILFLRNMSDWNSFQSSLATNLKSKNPWMAEFVDLLPNKGKANIYIIAE